MHSTLSAAPPHLCGMPRTDQMILDIGVVDDPERVGFYSGVIESIFSLMSFLFGACTSRASTLTLTHRFFPFMCLAAAAFCLIYSHCICLSSHPLLLYI